MYVATRYSQNIEDVILNSYMDLCVKFKIAERAIGVYEVIQRRRMQNDQMREDLTHHDSMSNDQSLQLDQTSEHLCPDLNSSDPNNQANTICQN